MQPKTRHSLIVRLRDEQNEAAWEDFVIAYEPFLQRLTQRMGVPERDIPDVVQQVLLAVARSLDGWKDDGASGSFRRWLATVSRNIVIKFMTRERRHVSASGGTDFVRQMHEVPSDPDEQQLRRYEHEMIVWAAEQVRDQFMATSWTAFWATTIEGRPVGEVAEELGISAGSIYMSRSRILARIRSRVQEIMA